MQVVSGPVGRHYEVPPAARVSEEMKAFLAWANRPDEVDPVIKADVAHFWFVTIHPFEEGNGRVARAIADLFLTRADGGDRRFYSMSFQIEAERDVYYHALERAQRGSVDVTTWLSWFVACLGRALNRADDVLSQVLVKAQLWNRIRQGE